MSDDLFQAIIRALREHEKTLCERLVASHRTGALSKRSYVVRVAEISAVDACIKLLREKFGV